ncbi:flagellar hook-associated protein FlgL [Campylobacterota bacterium]
MRATLSGYYRNLQFDQSKVSRELFDVTKQISSGQKIQYAHEDPSVFVDAVRLDNEVTTLSQIKLNAQKALQFSTNTDTTMNDMSKILEAMKVKLVSAANDTHSQESLEAIAGELRGLEKNLVQLANTSIDGKYLFSGSELKTKPIDANGLYQGNNEDMKAFIGSGVEQTFNINGADLFFGDENSTRRKITLNMPQMNQVKLYPDVMIDPNLPRNAAEEEYLTDRSTIRELMGDTDTVINTVDEQHFFYLRGTQSDGTTFKAKFALSDDETMGDLLNRIGLEFGNTPQSTLVDVTMNKAGQIEIEDRRAGSSKLDFHMVAATDLSGGSAADITTYPFPNTGLIDNLDDGETDLELILDGVSGALNPTLSVKSFMQSGLDPSGTSTTIEAIKYDRVNFAQDGAKLLGNVSQIVVDDNSYAQDSTKLSQVFSAYNNSVIPAVPINSLAIPVATNFNVEGTDINGDSITLQFDLDAGGATFSLTRNGAPVVTNYDIFNVDTPRTGTGADDVTYRQFMDVINMALSGNIPATNDTVGYDAAIVAANGASSVNLDHQGHIVFEQSGVGVTRASMAIYDSNSNNFTQPASAMVFNANNSLEISDAKTDFFGQIDKAISSVELGRSRADGSLKDARNNGIQNAIQALDDLSDHLYTKHSVAGVQSQTLQMTEERTDMLIITTKTLRSETIDVDIAEASLTLKQLELNYQAMLSSVSRISQLSLVNYL